MIILILYSISMLLTIQSSIVYDDDSEQEFKDSCSHEDYSKYCKEIGDCMPGTHVFCMFYQPGKIMGPHCETGRMVRLKNSTKTLILDRMNSIRAEVATGNASGQNDISLPRAYGMMRLEWDSKLAMFAQVWANQCQFTRGDVCRATQRFKNPGQIVSVFRFTYPNWTAEDENLKPEFVLSKKCLTQSKVNYAIESSIHVLLNHRKLITREHVLRLSWKDASPKGNNFFTIVNSKATHVGCGMSAFVTYHWNDQWKDHNFYALMLVCNLSVKPIEGDKLYNVDPPTSGGKYTEKCGCPKEYDEDENCLCFLNHREPTTSTIATTIDATATTTDATATTTDATATTTNATAITTDAVATTTDATATTTDSTATTTDATATTTDATVATTDASAKVDSTTAVTTSSPSLDTTITPDSGKGNQKGDQWCSNCVMNCSNQKQRVVVMPIIAMENAPQESLNIDSGNQTNARNYNWRKFDKWPMEIPRVEKFVLPFATENRRSLHDGDSVLLNKDLKILLNKVPVQERVRMEELFLKFVMKQQSHLIVSTKSPLMRPVKKYQAFNQADKVVLSTNRAMYMKNTLKTNDNIEEPVYEKLRTPDGKAWSKHSRRTGILTETNITIGENQKAEIQSQLAIPIIRKQKPLVSDKQIAKYRKNNNNEKLFNKDYSKTQIRTYYNLAGNDNRSLNNARGVTHYEKNYERLIEPKYIEENKITNHNSLAIDDFKVKRREYLYNEISKLRNKLRHLRRNVRPSYKNTKARFRPVLTPHKERQNTKMEDVNHFYMPDRAYPLHDF